MSSCPASFVVFLVSKINYPPCLYCLNCIGDFSRASRPERASVILLSSTVHHHRPPPCPHCVPLVSTPDSHMTCFLIACKDSFKHKAYYSNPWPDEDPWINSGLAESRSLDSGPCHNPRLTANLFNNSHKRGSVQSNTWHTWQCYCYCHYI